LVLAPNYMTYQLVLLILTQSCCEPRPQGSDGMISPIVGFVDVAWCLQVVWYMLLQELY
jgi:hypothetical protein